MRDLIGKLLDKKYRLVRVIGVGGMGTVYEAEHIVISRRVAVKVLSPEFASRPDAVERFFREAKAASAIGHPNIINIYDVGHEDDGTVYLVMDLLEGTNLCDLIQSEGRLRPTVATSIAAQILSALRAAHEKGIIHRDLKTDNVFLAVDARGRQEAKLLDFGIAKIGTGGSLGLTRDGDVVGTPYYLSPEQARGGRDVDERIDIWGVGVLMYEMLSGTLPYTGENYNEVLGRILLEEPRPLREHVPDLSLALAAVVEKAMHKDREERYPTARAMLDAMLPLLSASGDQLMSTTVVEQLRLAPPPSETTAKRRSDPMLRTADIEVVLDDTGAASGVSRGRRRKNRWIIGGAIGLAAAGAVGWVVFRASEQLTASPPPTRAAIANPAPPPIEKVAVALDGLPAGARVALDGVAVPVPVVLPKSGTSRHLEISAEGYAALDLAVIFDQNQRIAVEMRRDEVVAPAAAAAVKKNGNKREKRKKTGWEANPF
jgi:eukaryotic-like serine/threonine-protein kinase